jgi:hypothetical protein
MSADVTSRILKKLEQAREQAPDLRFGQLIAIIGELATDETGHSLWDVEDDDFLAALDRFTGDLARRGAGNAEPAAAPDRGGVTSSSGATPSQPPRPVS